MVENPFGDASKLSFPSNDSKKEGDQDSKKANVEEKEKFTKENEDAKKDEASKDEKMSKVPTLIQAGEGKDEEQEKRLEEKDRYAHMSKGLRQTEKQRLLDQADGIEENIPENSPYWEL